ncbi:hypothetical protein B0T13DRAFT_482742 [Neurospora crassa]|nr:hypothetical protein B0T13DRAFT_482742 [Neurospora crassa]
MVETFFYFLYFLFLAFNHQHELGSGNMEEGKGYICLGYGAIRDEVVSSRHLFDNRLIRMVAVWNEWLGVLLSMCINFRVCNRHRYPLLGYTIHKASYIAKRPITSLTN